MIDLVNYLLFGVFLLLRGLVNMWFGVLYIGVYFLMRIFIVPLYLDRQYFGFEFFMDTISYSLWMLRV